MKREQESDRSRGAGGEGGRQLALLEDRLIVCLGTRVRAATAVLLVAAAAAASLLLPSSFGLGTQGVALRLVSFARAS